MQTNMKKVIKSLLTACCLLGLAACADVPEIPYPLPDPDGGGGTSVGTLPFVSANLGDFAVQTIEGIDWSLGSSYAKATGYVSGMTTATRAWLVSPAINTAVSGDEGVYISFDNVLRYVKSSTDLKGWHKVLVSSDYSGDVTTANWTDLNFQPVESATQTWDFYAANPVSLPDEFVGLEKVYVAFYFQCDGLNSTTWELKNFNMQQGQPDTPTPVPDDVTPATIAEFNAAAVSTSVWYELTGTASGIKSGDQYGNFDLTDETGSVYVYGLLSEKGGAGKAFQDLVAKTGLKNGDKIKIHGQRGDYQGKTEVVNAYLVEILESGTDPAPNPGGEGDGSAASPYDVAYVLSAGNPGTTAWVKGYIVGTVKDGSQTYSDATFSTENASATNFLLADEASCADASKCIPVQLPAGDVRTALNLKDNPANLGKFVCLKGNLEKYFGQPGLKSVTEYSFDGNQEDNPGGDTGQEASFPYSADFTAGENGFAAQDVELGTLSYVWQSTSNYGWKASGYKGGAQNTESWLVSPVIDLTSATAATLIINQAVNYLKDGQNNLGNIHDFLSVQICDVALEDWTELTLDVWPGGTSWDFIDSKADVSSFCGKKVLIAFRYISTSAIATTWEVKSMSIN